LNGLQHTFNTRIRYRISVFEATFEYMNTKTAKQLTILLLWFWSDNDERLFISCLTGDFTPRPKMNCIIRNGQTVLSVRTVGMDKVQCDTRSRFVD
jgi:hypothetical protein